MKTPAGWADDLACPVCHQALRFQDAQVVCSGCGLVYPIVDGIAVLIPERAMRPDR
ncbi:MAG TPA: Trm112 family protein [Terracidiphilus sp.]|nr:Trm112 family protein [Terracidiphilus sp.]